jgi:low density lipoprotein receptor-related protein 5/6
MYWSDWGEPAKIERASMDGSNRTVLHNTGLTWPNGLAIDYQLQRLYWADAFTDRIEYSSVDGTGREILLTVATGLHHPFAITISGDQVYWTDWANFTIYTAHKQAAISPLSVYSNFIVPPYGIEAVDPNRQQTNSKSFCVHYKTVIGYYL